MELIKLTDVNQKIIKIRGLNVILDSDVADIYGVATREINQAIKNNPDKFPEGYIFELNEEEMSNLKSKFLISSWGGSRSVPKAFTKKGCYMLATILKSPQATQATIAIIEAFEKVQDMTLFYRRIDERPRKRAKTASSNTKKRGIPFRNYQWIQKQVSS